MSSQHWFTKIGRNRAAGSGGQARWWLLMLLAVTGLVGGTAGAEDAGSLGGSSRSADQNKLLAEVIRLDIELFLRSSHVFVKATADPVWQVRPEPGRLIVQLPVELEPADEPVELGTSVLRLRGGRFLCWQLNDPEAPKPEKAEPTQGPPPLKAPGLTRRFTLDPDGTIRWKLDRFIPGGEVKPAAGGYALKLDSKLLNKRHPGDPPRVKRSAGEAERTYRRRRLAEEASYRKAAARYRDDRKSVAALPTEFDKPAPKRVWAVFEFNTSVSSLGLSGPPPLPWQIGIDQIDAIRDLVASKPKGESETGLLPLQTQSSIRTMTTIVTATPHPYSHRVVAYALSLSRLVPYAKQDDDLYKLIQTLIQSEDSPARRVVLKELITTLPPTKATRTLLASAAEDTIDPQLQLMRLKGLMQGGGTSPGQTQEVLAAANRMLADENGPPPSAALQELLNAARANPESIGGLEQGVRFTHTGKARLAEAVAFVVGKAATEPLAARWLDRNLLGSPDPALVLVTLRTLDRVDSGRQPLRPAADKAVSFLFGAPTQKRSASGGTALRLDQPITIESTGHKLFDALGSDDEDTRAIAWRVLRHFAAPPAVEPDGGQQPVNPGQPAGESLFLRLGELALFRSPTPAEAVGFLALHRDEPDVTEALTQLVIRGDGAAVRRAARTLFGSGRPVGPSLAGLAPQDRHRFVARMYDGVRSGQPPLVCGLIRYEEDEGALALWLGDQFSNGVLPESIDWFNTFGGEERLLSLMQDPDAKLAVAAAAGLIAAAGGHEQDAYALFNRFEQLREPSMIELEAEWIHARGEVFATKLRQAAGAYRLDVSVWRQRAGGAGPAGPGVVGRSEEQFIPLGVVEFWSDGKAARLADLAIRLEIPDARLAIRVKHPSDLKIIINSELAKLPLEDLEEPITLVPKAGAWSGRTTLTDGRVLEITMTRTDAPVP